jgi:hypothetical protein
MFLKPGIVLCKMAKKLEESSRRLMSKKYAVYAQIRCGILSVCTSKLEAILKVAGVGFTRLLEPDPETLASYADVLYSGPSAEIIELTDGVSRMFYLASPQIPVRPDGELKPEFLLFFNVKSKEALELLLRVIGEKRISGRRYGHRSEINLVVSFLGSFLFSSIINSGSYFLQSFILLALTFLIYLVLDYPFSLLRLKGIEMLSHDPFEKKNIKILKVVRMKKGGKA